MPERAELLEPVDARASGILASRSISSGSTSLVEELAQAREERLALLDRGGVELGLRVDQVEPEVAEEQLLAEARASPSPARARSRRPVVASFSLIWPRADDSLSGEYLRAAGVSLATPPIQETPLFPADAYVIRLATEQDAAALRRLAALDSARPLTGRVLIGEIDGKPAAALLAQDRRARSPTRSSRTDGAARPPARCARPRVEAVDREPSLRERMLDALRRPGASYARAGP